MTGGHRWGRLEVILFILVVVVLLIVTLARG